jgi:histidinol-phosphate phosphatase family protein
VALAAFLHCPHHRDGVVPGSAIHCDCRKPEPGLILAAAARLGTDPRDCWVVGDKLSDAEAGHRAGCRTILLAGPGTHAPGPPYGTATDLSAAVVILAAGRR